VRGPGQAAQDGRAVQAPMLSGLRDVSAHAIRAAEPQDVLMR
jgi:hypothetical protein